MFDVTALEMPPVSFCLSAWLGNLTNDRWSAVSLTLQCNNIIATRCVGLARDDDPLSFHIPRKEGGGSHAPLATDLLRTFYRFLFPSSHAHELHTNFTRSQTLHGCSAL